MRPMSDVSQRLEELALPLRPQDAVDCRGCEVHCDKVVYPSACLDRSCPFVYAYEEHGHTFIGCMQKVYEAEIDLDMLRMAERQREGFGAVRAIRVPCRCAARRSSRATSTARASSAASTRSSTSCRRDRRRSA